MRTHLLKLVWVLLLVTFISGFFIHLGPLRHTNMRFAAFQVLLVTGIASFAFLSYRMIGFQRQLRRVVRQLLEGNYDVGIRRFSVLNDETTILENELNKLADQLREYDRIRAERVRTSFQAFDELFRLSPQGLLIVDVEKSSFRMNPAMQKRFGIEQETFSFEALDNIPANQPFWKLLRRVIHEEKVPVDTQISLQIPVRNTKLMLPLQLRPLKNNNGNVIMVIMAEIALE